MARDTEEEVAYIVCQQGRDRMETGGMSKKLFLYNGPLKNSQDLPIIQSHELQEKKQMISIDLDEIWNVKRNKALGHLKTPKSSSTTIYYSRYGEIRDIGGTGPKMHTISRTTDNTLELKWSSKSKENQNRVNHCLNKEDEFDF